MFESGLPIRGAIAFGDFVFTAHVFAGLPILDAHELGNRLDLAACATHQTAVAELKALHTVAFLGYLQNRFPYLFYRDP